MVVRAVTQRLALDYLFSLESRGIKLDLDRMRAALAELGRPERAFPSILIAGTNGKGSTSTLLASALAQGGRKVGLYTSPHLLDFRERIRVDGRMLSADALVDWVERDRAIWDRFELSFFEATTALAFRHFAAERIDVGVLEVGMGGRLDATNTVEPILSVVTALGMDHAQILGDTAAKIAREKAGIFRSGVPAVAGSGPREAIAALSERARELDTPLHLRRECLRVEALSAGEEGGLSFTLRPRRNPGEERGRAVRLTTRLPGRHQVANAASAYLALRLLREQGFAVSDAEVRTGFARARWPGRLERPRPDLPLFADAAHNREGARAVADALGSLARGREILLVAGMVEGKDHAGFFREMRRIARRVAISAPACARAAPPDLLARAAISAGMEPTVFPRVADALRFTLTAAQHDGGPCVLLAGSFFTLEEGYRELGVEPMESLWG